MLYLLQVNALVAALVAVFVFAMSGLIATSLVISRSFSRLVRRARFTPRRIQ